MVGPPLTRPRAWICGPLPSTHMGKRNGHLELVTDTTTPPPPATSCPNCATLAARLRDLEHGAWVAINRLLDELEQSVDGDHESDGPGLVS